MPKRLRALIPVAVATLAYLAGGPAIGDTAIASGTAGASQAQNAAQGTPGTPGQRAGGPVRQRKRVLAWADTRNGQAQHESVGHSLAVIERLGYESGLWDTFIRTDSSGDLEGAQEDRRHARERRP